MSSRALVIRGITVKGALGVRRWSYDQAIRITREHRYPLEKMHTHTFHLDQVEQAIHTLAGDVPGQEGIHLTVIP